MQNVELCILPKTEWEVGTSVNHMSQQQHQRQVDLQASEDVYTDPASSEALRHTLTETEVSSQKKKAIRVSHALSSPDEMQVQMKCEQNRYC